MNLNLAARTTLTRARPRGHDARMMVDDCFGARRRVRSAKVAVRHNEGLKQSGAEYAELVDFFEDLIAALADQRPEERDEALHYVVRTMGVVVKRHAAAAYRPYGYKDPFAPDSAAPPKKPPPKSPTITPEVPRWRYPVINFPPSDGKGGFDGDFRKYSALKMFGYTVGETHGWSRADRRTFLTDFMEMNLPPIVTETFGDEYGRPLTSDRLRKVANVIATNASNFYRNDARRYEVAIAHWEEDLLFLRDRYYEGMGLKFMPWPSTRPH